MVLNVMGQVELPRLLNPVMVVLPLVFPLIGVLAPVSAVAATLHVLWMIPLLVCGALLLQRRAEGANHGQV